jgi:hypothetical protein
MDSRGATLVAGPGDAGLRAAIAKAQTGDTVVLIERVEVLSPVYIDKALTLEVDPAMAYRIWIQGSFSGELLRVAAQGITLNRVRLIGSPVTDGLRVVEDVVLRDCMITDCRAPVVDDSWPSSATVRLERVMASFNRQGLESGNLDAKDCTFSFNGGYAGVGGYNAYLDGCRIENNQGDGLILTYGTARNCTFRFNGGMGIRFDPDPGILNLSGCMFYANTGGGILLREEAIATVDNCTFTRHTGPPAVIVAEANNILFRHCTIADNVVVGGEPGWWPAFPVGGAFSIQSAARIELQNCLIADNPSIEDPNASGLVGEFFDGGGNVIGGPAGLGVLRDNGGPTLSLLPLPGSPAIDAGVASELVLDARGLSRLAGAAPDAGAVESGAAALADVDADGLPDIWETFRGLSSADPADAASDVDGDGVTALDEFRSRTDPNDAQSVLRIDEVFLLPPPVLQQGQRLIYIFWRYSPGVTYEVQTSTDLRLWHKASGSLHTASPWSESRLVYEIQAESPKSFYRVAVKVSPFD